MPPLLNFEFPLATGDWPHNKGAKQGRFPLQGSALCAFPPSVDSLEIGGRTSRMANQPPALPPFRSPQLPRIPVRSIAFLAVAILLSRPGLDFLSILSKPSRRAWSFGLADS